MDIKLVSKNNNFLKSIWVAARTCYSSLSPIELCEQEPTEEEMLRITNIIMTSKHSSVLEHCSMTFAVKNVSRTLLAQYTRHRISVSLSVQSQRYVSEQSSKNLEGIFDYVVPLTIEKNIEANQVYVDFMKACQAKYDELLSLGVNKEDARFVLPGGAGTNFVTTLNLRSFMDVYHKRVITPGAQWEIKEMMIAMKRLLVEQEPWLDKYLPEK